MTAARQADAVEALVGLLSDRTREARDRQVTQRPPGPSERGSPPRTWGIRRSWPRSGTSSTVHPHARGEYGRRRPDPGQPLGSPPRTWGIRATPPSGSCGKSVHPHARGEYDANRITQPSFDGSPPRTWGIRLGRRLGLGVVRFTPTHVGNTASVPCRICKATVHPHARGEYAHERHSLSELLGSPPRTWGILVAFAGRERGRRFTPTHVGNT